MAVTVRCEGPCGVVVYEGPASDMPDPDGQVLLTRFADRECPVGGQTGGCPNVTEVAEERAEQRPDRLRAALRVLRDRAPRTRGVPLPALVSGAPVEITVTWPVPLPDPGYRVVIGQELASAALLGVIRVAVKAGSRTPGGCVLIVAATRDVGEGQAGLHLAAVP